ncbi:MAG: hypothetical protein IT462_04110 [Planctomycetes bacterium]|nr:hypothetical protein [Planctomycetota bacterium]
MWGKKKDTVAKHPSKPALAKAPSKGAMPTSKDTGKIDRHSAPKRPTISATSMIERMELVKVCEGIGALAIGGRGDKVAMAVEALHKSARTLLLQQHLDVWLPKFEEHFANLEKVLGPAEAIKPENLVTEIKEKVAKGGFPTMREFVIRVVLPVVSYHGLLLFLNNQAGVRLPDHARDKVIQKMNHINRILGGSCAAMVLQESMSVG